MCNTERLKTTNPEYLTDLLQRRHKVFVTCYGEGQKHVECLETEAAELSLKCVCVRKGQDRMRVKVYILNQQKLELLLEPWQRKIFSR